MKEFRATMLTSAYEIILVHNHPSGDLSPNAKDNVMAEKLGQLCKPYQIAVFSFINIGQSYLSGVEEKWR